LYVQRWQQEDYDTGLSLVEKGQLSDTLSFARLVRQAIVFLDADSARAAGYVVYYGDVERTFNVVLRARSEAELWDLCGPIQM
jgi:hypothetical protein